MDVTSWQSAGWALLGSLAGAVGTGIVVWAREEGRQICFDVKNLRFGPSFSFSHFMGGNIPSDDLVSLSCEIQFFSNKTQKTGLHDFCLEFCRTTYIGAVSELTISGDSIYREYLSNDMSTLKRIELPSREFVAFSIYTELGRSTWQALKMCDSVRLVARTPEGKTKRFKIGRSYFPQMPPEGIRGADYMAVSLESDIEYETRLPAFVIKTTRWVKASERHRYAKPNDCRYWSGSDWVQHASSAMTYRTPEEARQEAANLKI